MTDVAAALHVASSFDRRVVQPGSSRRAMRRLVDRVGIGLGALVAAGILITTITVAAAWIINAAFVTNRDLHATAGPASIALAGNRSDSIRTADVRRWDRGRVVVVDTLTFETKWAFATGPDAAGTDAMPPDHPAKATVAATEPAPSAPSQTKLAIKHASTQVADLTPTGSIPPSTAVKNEPPRPALSTSSPPPDVESRTAVYDIAAHTVYLPKGERLEAHSGLGNKLDDPRFVNVKDWGPTPPNVYDLSLREQLFHEVRAIRLNPVDGSKMFGRDGILAHTYMLGANGQSNGCVSFKNYNAFLQAYLRGEVDRLVVVTRLGDTSWRTVSAQNASARRYASNQ